MFVNPTYLQLDDGVFDDENCNQDWVDEVNIVDIGGLVTMNEDGHCDNVDVPKGLSAPVDRALICLHETMVEITAKCGKSASIEL
jgi:hypothetical protein